MKKIGLILLIITIILNCAVAQVSCNNEDFETGDLSGWKTYTGRISGSGVVTINNREFSATQHQIQTGGIDPILSRYGETLEMVAPGGEYSLRLGNSRTGGNAERITNTILVSAETAFFIYQYAVVMEDPGHDSYEQPRFEVRVFDKDGKILPCGEYSVKAGPDAEGFISVDRGDIQYRPWTTAGINLNDYIGDSVTIEFMTTDCSQGGHYGYAYVDASCKELEISVDGFCSGATQASLKAPDGFLSYSWTSGDSPEILSTKQDALVFNPVLGQTFNVTLKAVTECSTTITGVLKIPKEPTFVKANDYLCETGSKTIIKYTGEEVGSYYWVDLDTSASYMKLEPGPLKEYIVLIKDKNGCVKDRDTLYISKNNLDVGASITNIGCGGGTKGAVSVTPISNYPPLKYSWSNGSSTQNLLGANAGVHQLNITDSLGCTFDTSFTIIGGVVPLTVDTNLTRPNCHNSKNGGIELDIVGGKSPFNYTWSNGATTKDIDSLPADIYYYSIVDSLNCEVHGAVDLSPNSTRIYGQTNYTKPTCIDFYDGSVGVTVRGGTRPYRYSWSTGHTDSSITNIKEGDYKVYITDAYNCVDSASVSIPAPSQINQTVDTITEIPEVEGVRTLQSFADIGRTDIVSYSWIPDYNLSCNNCAVNTVTPYRDTEYVQTIKYTGGCTKKIRYKVSVNEFPFFYVPTAFSPNNDLVNDEFKVITYATDEFNLTIYNRWGQEVYSSADKESGWDGKFNGQDCPMGAYLVHLDLKLSGRKQPEFYRHWLTLVR